MTQRPIVTALGREECVRLLAQRSFGRLAFLDHVGVLPMVIPVNYVLVDGEITFRTGPGSKLGIALRGEPVAFEVDGLDPDRELGWSVVVRGFAQLVTDAGDLARVQELELRAWAPGDKPHYVRIEARRVSGRRIDPAPAEAPRDAVDVTRPGGRGVLPHR